MIKLTNILNNRWIWLDYFAFIIFSVSLFALFSITVSEAHLIQPDGTKTKIIIPFQKDQLDFQNLNYALIVNSNINQQADINIAVDDIIDKISVNGEELDLNPIKQAYARVVLNDWKRGYIFGIPLKAGQNNIHISGQNTGGGYTLKFKQKPFFWIWIILFTAIGLSLSHLCIYFTKFFTKFIFVWKKTIELP